MQAHTYDDRNKFVNPVVVGEYCWSEEDWAAPNSLYQR